MDSRASVFKLLVAELPSRDSLISDWTKISDLGVDSLRFMDIIMKLEADLGISLPDQAIDRILAADNLGEMVGIIIEHCDSVVA